MGIVYFYAGNFITGKIYRATIHEDFIDEALEILSQDPEMGFLVWAIYNTSQAKDVREIQFNNLMNHAYQEYKDNAA